MIRGGAARANPNSVMSLSSVSKPYDIYTGAHAATLVSMVAGPAATSQLLGLANLHGSGADGHVAIIWAVGLSWPVVILPSFYLHLRCC